MTGPPLGPRHPPVAPELVRALAGELTAAVELRHALHRDPRLGGDERDSLDAVAAALGLEPEPVADTGGMVRLDPGAPVPPGVPPGGGVRAVAVRAELDALPVVERSGLPFSAAGPVAHVCGHDVHTAALVALVRAVARVGPGLLPAPLLAVFQPREEAAPSGAADVLAAPAFLAHRPGAILGVHVQPELPRGVVSARDGAVNASADEIEVVVHGRAGHGGYPHRTRDPVLALAHVVVGLHHVVSRRVNPLEAAVVTVGELRAGSAPNVVPDSASARGTVRALDADRDALLEILREVTEHTAAAHGCSAELSVVPNESAVVNDDGLARAVAAALVDEVADGVAETERGATVVDDTFRSCGADDFAHYGAVLPSLMLFVGAGDPDVAPGSGPGLHHPEFSPEDAMVGEVARALLTAVVAAGHHLVSPHAVPWAPSAPEDT